MLNLYMILSSYYAIMHVRERKFYINKSSFFDILKVKDTYALLTVKSRPISSYICFIDLVVFLDCE